MKIKIILSWLKINWGYVTIATTIVTSIMYRDARMQKKAVEQYSEGIKQVSYEGKIDKLIAYN